MYLVVDMEACDHHLQACISKYTTKTVTLISDVVENKRQTSFCD